MMISPPPPPPWQHWSPKSPLLCTSLMACEFTIMMAIMVMAMKILNLQQQCNGMKHEKDYCVITFQ